jgi:hypothetical protein
MNAESTYVRPTRPRPTLVPPPGGDGTRLAALVLALPMRVAATPLGRRALAAAWFAGKQRIAPDRVRALGQRRVSAIEREVLVVAEAGASKVPSAYVVVRKGRDGWAAVS